MSCRVQTIHIRHALPNARKNEANSLIQSNSKRNGRIGCTDGTFEGAIQQTFLLQEMPHTQTHTHKSTLADLAETFKMQEFAVFATLSDTKSGNAKHLR